MAVWALIFLLRGGGSPYYAVIRDRKIYLEVAADPAGRSAGLMFRDSLGKDHGMLFIFPRQEEVSFWMKNTYIPLDIAFIDASGEIVRTAEMKPLDETSVPSTQPVKYALEVNAGYFERHSIGPGDRVYFSDAVREIEAR